MLRGVTMGRKGGIIPRAPNHCVGRQMSAGSPKSPNSFTRTFCNTLHFLPKDLRCKHGGAKLASCPGRHLTSLRPWMSLLQFNNKIIKQTIDNLFQFDHVKSYNYLWKDTFAPVVPRLKSQGFNATALQRPCLPLSAFTASLHYLPRVTCDKTPNIVTWSEYLKICCHVIITR